MSISNLYAKQCQQYEWKGLDLYTKPKPKVKFLASGFTDPGVLYHLERSSLNSLIRFTITLQ